MRLPAQVSTTVTGLKLFLKVESEATKRFGSFERSPVFTMVWYTYVL